LHVGKVCAFVGESSGERRALGFNPVMFGRILYCGYLTSCIWRRIEVSSFGAYDSTLAFQLPLGGGIADSWTSFLLGLQSKGCGAISERVVSVGTRLKFRRTRLCEELGPTAPLQVHHGHVLAQADMNQGPGLDSQAMPTHSNFSHCFHGLSLTIRRFSA